MKKLTTIAALLIALAISVSSASALTSNQVKEIKKKVLSVPVPEMPATAADLVVKAERKDRQAVAVTAVRAIVMKHRAAAPLVISAISKVAPDLAPTVAVAAAEISTDQAPVIARAAATAAPAQAAAVNSAVNTAVPTAVASAAPIRTGTGTRANTGTGGAAHNHTPSQGTIVIGTNPINTETGGSGNGQFPNTPPETPDSPAVVIYNQPPQP